MARATISVMQAALLLVTGYAIQDDAARGRTIMRHEVSLDAAEDSGAISVKGAGASEALAEQSVEDITLLGEEEGRDADDVGGRGESHDSATSGDRPDGPPGQRGRGRGPDGNGPPGQRGRGRGLDGQGPPGHQGKGSGKAKSRGAGTKNKKSLDARDIKSQESPGGDQTKTKITIITKAGVSAATQETVATTTTTTPINKGLFGRMHLPFNVPNIFGRSQPPATTTTTTLPPAATLPNGTMSAGGDQTKTKITIITEAEDSAATQETVDTTTTTTTTPANKGLFGGIHMPFHMTNIFGSSQPQATTTTTRPPAATVPNGTMTLHVFIGDSCEGMAVSSLIFDYLPDFRECGACFPSNSGQAVKVCDGGGVLRVDFFPGSSCEVAMVSGDIVSMEGCVQVKDQPVRLALNGTGAFRVDAMEFCKCPGAAI